MFRRATNFLGLSGLDDAAQIHHEDAAADVFHHREIVRDEQIRDAVLALKILEQVDDLRLHAHIERADGLIADDELRLHGHGARDPDTLALATAEFVRQARSMRRIEPHVPQQGVDALAPR